ncbi:tetratricopeptide repeat protein [Tahibacter amnicola]|uniref:Tetratricopeptide repeat protein n=1 Tax=Tahibacter amnicola TaxID=2976241 RepID=A0ABY6BKM8_9GAMM|nr:tetratricopeptide repeat protein [Tahibacter amnicola]UXI70027.1 tetratricopeptide repeat protein [Tahibacter amnicola]
MDRQGWLQQAMAALQHAQPAQAAALLREALHADPTDAEAARLLSAALLATGDGEGALRVLDEALSHRPQWAPLHAARGEVQSRLGNTAEAEAAFEAALRIQPNDRVALRSLLRLWLQLSRPAQVLERIDRTFPHAIPPDFLRIRAEALIAAGRGDDAAMLSAGFGADRSCLAADLQLALSLSQAQQAGAAESLARRLLPTHRPEAWFALARALLAQDRLGEAEAALVEVVRHAPGHLLAQEDLVQLRWTRSGDPAIATAALDEALRRDPACTALLVHKARLYDYARGPEAARALLADAARQRPDDALLAQACAEFALKFDAAVAVRDAERAWQLAPQRPGVAIALADATLAAGQPDRALRLATALLAQDPADQHALAVQAVALRQLGKPEYGELYDYSRFVSATLLETPSGWNRLEDYLGDLAGALRRMHLAKAHPVGQSLRGGTQTHQELEKSEDPAIRAFFQAIDGPIRRHLTAIGPGSDPLRRRYSENYAIRGIWSVQLRASGFHTNHFHQEGWFSSACYIDLPPAISDDCQDGWLQFGQPGYPTSPPTGPDHFIRPQPGLLALFPSYFWHGTVPFTGSPDHTRLTIAFDIVPA